MVTSPQAVQLFSNYFFRPPESAAHAGERCHGDGGDGEIWNQARKSPCRRSSSELLDFARLAAILYGESTLHGAATANQRKFSADFDPKTIWIG
jgi:hypothetical protein